MSKIVCPDCKKEGTIFVEGRVSIPLMIDPDSAMYSGIEEAVWDWDNAEMVDSTIYECFECDFTSDYHTADDFIVRDLTATE